MLQEETLENINIQMTKLQIDILGASKLRWPNNRESINNLFIIGD